MSSRIRIYLASAFTTLALVLGLGVSVLQPAMVAAAPVDVLDTCKAKSSESKVCKGVGENDLYGLIKNIINLLLAVIGIVAVIMIIVGGIRYTTSAGDPGQTKNARDTIVYAVVGLVIAIMSYAIVNFVLSKI